MHSTYSYDGKVSLADLKKLLQANGVAFCCMTEHTDELTAEAAAAFVAECRALSDEQFVFIPGFEVPYKDTHVLHIGGEKFLGQTADATQLLAWKETAALVVLAHPVRNHFEVDESLLAVLDGVEVWNQQYEGKRAPRFRSLALLKTLKQQKPMFLATGGLDLHRREHFGTPQIEIEADTLTEETIIQKLKAGEFVIKGNQMELDAQGVFIQGGGFGTRLQSAISILTIGTGKFINATLAQFGISLPKSLRQLIRARV